MLDWDEFVARLRMQAHGLHRLLEPCPEDRIQSVQKEFGELPLILATMVRRFNGSELFIVGGPLVTLLGISTVPPPPPLEWAPEWYIDKLTAKWRAEGRRRDADWAIAMTNYGGLVLLDSNGSVKEWDTADGRWLSKDRPFKDWIEGIMREGETMVRQ